MKIAIIGGGWVGCHLAYKLKNEHNITIFEKNEYLFEEASSNNQNRLHLGYHYPRNYTTRKLCFDTFDKFINDYSGLTENVINNMYCIPINESIIDLGTFIQIFAHDETFKPSFLNNVEGCILTKERYINFEKAIEFFNKELKHLIIKKTINREDLASIAMNFDLVIDCTNNSLIEDNTESFYEFSLMLFYKTLNKIDFDALTLMDGNFFSIYPYKKNMFTVTDVEYTPLLKTENLIELNHFIEKNKSDLVNERKNKIEEKIKKYFPNFLKDFVYVGFTTSIKNKSVSKSDNRAPIITQNDNIIKCFTGKIQGIYLIEEYVKKFIDNAKK
jgi:hypothetical protein